MEPNQQITPPPMKKSSGGVTGGIVLIVIGILFLLRNFIPDFEFGDYWPLILVAVGASMLWNSWRNKQGG